MRGVLITRVEPMSSSFDGGIERGTVLLEINRQPVESVADYRRIARAARAGDILTLYVYAPDLDQRQLKTDPRRRSRDVQSAVDAQIPHPRHRRRSGHPRFAADDARVRRLRVRRRRDRPGRARARRARGARPGAARRQDAGHGRHRGARAAAHHERGAAGRSSISGHGTISTAVEATKKGAFDFIEKPFASERVLVSLRNALDSAAAARREPVAEEGGRSPASDDRRERRR